MAKREVKPRKWVSTESERGLKRKTSPAKKPHKPYPDFPLYAHASGQWAKKIRYKVYYFGVWDNHAGALAEYVRQRDFLYAGTAPPGGDDVVLEELVNRFLIEQRARRDMGEISARQFDDYQRDGGRILETLGRARPVESLQPADFTRLRAAVLDGRNATTATNVIVRMRSIFSWGYRNRVLGRQVEYGDSFRVPSARARRQALRRRTKKTFTADEIRAMLDATTNHPKLHAMILLGINAGLGNVDCAMLRRENLNLSDGWLDYPRPKTEMDRRAALWPETIAAINNALEDRARSKIIPSELATRVFVTRLGETYTRVSDKGTKIDSIGMQFRRVLDHLKIHQAGLGFYALRHTFRTVADETKDFPAVDLVMGHVASDVGGAPHAIEMAARYREKISDERLQAIAEYVRSWLFTEEMEPNPPVVNELMEFLNPFWDSDYRDEIWELYINWTRPSSENIPAIQAEADREGVGLREFIFRKALKAIRKHIQKHPRLMEIIENTTLNKSEVSPLTPRAYAILQLLRALPPSRALTGPQILDILFKKDKSMNMDMSTLQRTLNELKPYGLRNKRRVGYYLDRNFE